jgi:hypothetical protein
MNSSQTATVSTTRRVNYRKLAFTHYPPFCAHCGYGIPDVLEVAHIDCNRANNEPSNLVILCPNCHKMHDLDLIATATIIEMRDRPKVVTWAKRMKDAGRKAADTRKRRAAGKKAAATRALSRAAAEIAAHEPSTSGAKRCQDEFPAGGTLGEPRLSISSRSREGACLRARKST